MRLSHFAFRLSVVVAAAQAAFAQPDDGELVTSMERAYQQAVERAAPSVVAIWVQREEDEKKPRPIFGVGPFWKRPKDAPASGLVVDADGHILTSYFNVSGKVRAIRVALPSGEKKEARLLGYHAAADVALLKIAATELATLRRAPLQGIKVAMPVVAVGRAPDGRGLTVNPGIVSAPARLYGRGVQMDAKMNFGNVGGPLVDTEGRLVGLTCKVDTKSAGSFGQNSGVAFAVTWDKLDDLLPELKKGGKLTGTGQPFLGVGPDVEGDPDGVVVGTIVAGGSAEAAGVKQGDVIMEFDGSVTKNFDDLREAINRRAIGDRVKVKLRRGQEVVELEMPLGERPGD